MQSRGKAPRHARQHAALDSPRTLESLKAKVSELWVPLAVLAGGVVVTVIASLWVAHGTRYVIETRFENAVRSTAAVIEKRMETNVALLHGMSGLFAAQPDLTRAEFHAYVERLELSRRYPGIFGLGFAKALEPNDVGAVEKHARDMGFESFRIWPAGDREELTTILYLEPVNERNLAAIGYDMFSEPVRRAAMTRARDTGLPTLSSKVTLVQEITDDKQAGFLLYVPLYATGSVPRSVEERRAALNGYVYAVFRADDLFRHLYRADPRPAVRFQLYDGAEANAAALLHDSRKLEDPASRLEDGELSATLTLDTLGRPWTIVVESLPSLARAREEAEAPLVALAGLLVSAMLFSLVRRQNEAKHRAQDLAAAMLALSEERSVLLEKEQAARTEAERANGLKDEFLATVSHELRTPLTAILGWTHLLKAARLPAEKLARGFEVIERNARSQAQLVEDLLDVSRIIAGKLRLETVRVKVDTIVDAAIDSMRPAAAAKQIKLERAVTSDVCVWGDGARLQQVVWNLISNAVKFTPPGGRVHVSVEPTGDYVEVVVSDTGKGIRPEFMPHVFDRFRQAEGGPDRGYSGLGIGLAIVRHLVEQHGGTVSAKSEGEGRGATFVVCLPRARTSAVEAPIDGEAPSRPRCPEELTSALVLVVDDEADAREVVKEMLAECGIRVTTAGSAAEAFTLLREQQPDYLVSDIGMPHEDGFALIRRVRELPSLEGGATRALAVTAYARADERSRILAAGFDAHLAKPFGPEELLHGLVALGREPRL